MKVFVVIHLFEWCEREVVGVYSTQELADEAAAKVHPGANTRESNVGVDEHELDALP